MELTNGEWRLEKVALTDLVLDPALQPRLELNKSWVDELATVFDQLPPVEAFDTERGRLLADGRHRYAAAKALGLKDIDARIRQGSYREAREHAATANKSHGLRLSATERSRAAETLLLLDASRSDRAIAQLVGCSHTSVANIRRRLESEGRMAKVAIRTTSNGQARDYSTRSEPRPVEPTDPWAGIVLDGDVFERINEIEDASVDLMFVDPPYGILAKQGEEWDTFEDVDALMAFTRRWLDAALPKLKPTGRLFVCFSQWHVHRLRGLLDELADPSRFDLIYSNTIIWHYKNILSQPNDRCEFKLAHEPILYYRARYAPVLDFSVYGEEQGDVWEIATPQSNFKEGKRHPAQKPLELLRRIIAVGCPADGLILDPFAGSGTTGVAAFEMGRSFRLIENNAEYSAIIRDRLGQATSND